MPHSIKTVLFDAYGTLLNINSLDTILQEHFGNNYQELSARWRKKQLEYTWLRTLMNRYKPFSEVTMDALFHACTSLDLELNESIQEQLFDEYLRLAAYPEVPEVLMLLREYLPLGILSNANQVMLNGAVKRNGLDDMFAHILSVEEIGIYKPRPEVYQLACSAFGLEPHEILFISSNTWDVAGAKAFGLTVAWLNRSGGVLEELDVVPDYSIKELEELLKITRISTE